MKVLLNYINFFVLMSLSFKTKLFVYSLKFHNFQTDLEDEQPERAMWSNQMEFLMSCIATSVGLGNVWRFPFVAYENGGGAFLIPYIIVLFLVGKPMYYLEGVLGQFSSRNSIKVWSVSPAMKGN